MSGPFAFVTLITSDSYLPGALVVAASLKDLHPTPAVAPEVDFKTVCLVTPETLDVKSIKALRKAFDEVIGVEIIEANSPSGLDLLGRPDLNTVLTKLHAFRLTEFSKIIFLDADILPLQPISHLFLTPHEFSACPDVGWPDIFNSGLMVFEPGENKFQEMWELLKTKGSWDGADQGLLNEWRGSNWNRLSFTYNVTPTAVYTYAPAYERFGATIKAIHFIGQNKPWASIPWRAPIPLPSQDSMRSYGFSNLVDRWFAVYDRHYRPPVIATEEEWRMQYYAPAWETSAFEPSMNALALEDIRRMATEGVPTPSLPVAPGEGEYRSLPLEGRIDLMRPRRWTESQDQSSQATHPNQPDAAPGQQETNPEEYRPPGREGLPSYLYRPPTWLQNQVVDHELPFHPPTEPPRQQEPVHHEQDQHRPEPEGQTHEDHENQCPQSPEYRPPSPPLVRWNPAVEPPPSEPPSHVAMAFAEQQYTNVWDLPPSRPIYPHQQHSPEYHDPWFAQMSPGKATPPSHYQQPTQPHNGHPDQHRHHHHHHHHHHQHHHPHQHRQHQHHQQYHQHWQRQEHYGGQQPKESPRHQTYGGYQQPHHHHEQQSYPFPVTGVHHQEERHGHQETSFSDQSQIHHQRYQPYQDVYHGQEPRDHGAPPHHQGRRPEDFFYAPQPTKIPSNLIREGHYAAVTTSDPKPDYSKVGVVFPWESRSRPAPRRVFPDWDPKPPRLQTPPITTAKDETVKKEPIQPAQPEPAPVPVRQRSPSPPPHVKRKFNPPPSPPRREGSLYINAWDTDQGIQRYAHRLQGRPSPFSPQPWPTHAGQEAYAAKQKRTGQEEEEDEFTTWAEKAEASSRDGDDEDDEVESPLLSPRSAARRRAAKAKGKSYRHQEVQTDPIITESRGVQVSIITESGNYPEMPSFRDSHRRRTERPYSFASTNTFVDDPSREVDQSSYIPAIAPETQEIMGHSISLPVLRTRESSEDSITTANDSSIISSPVKEIEDVGTPKVRISLPEQDDHATSGIPTTSAPVVRRTGRVFSPSTGVDIFKRGSEEVLARFLVQQPSGWDSARANAGPPTPSAIH
ncbi:hypothetical protein CPB86DRAFT_749350 [Serendipita vermifera]|nr:hypothetical protein CPB86DRAFT_749350 [Serendipita vermifera]